MLQTLLLSSSLPMESSLCGSVGLARSSNSRSSNPTFTSPSPSFPQRRLSIHSPLMFPKMYLVSDTFLLPCEGWTAASETLDPPPSALASPLALAEHSSPGKPPSSLHLTSKRVSAPFSLSTDSPPPSQRSSRRLSNWTYSRSSKRATFEASKQQYRLLQTWMHSKPATRDSRASWTERQVT